MKLYFVNTSRLQNHRYWELVLLDKHRFLDNENSTYLLVVIATFINPTRWTCVEESLNIAHRDVVYSTLVSETSCMFPSDSLQDSHPTLPKDVGQWIYGLCTMTKSKFVNIEHMLQYTNGWRSFIPTTLRSICFGLPWQHLSVVQVASKRKRKKRTDLLYPSYS